MAEVEVKREDSFLRSALSGSFAGICQTYSGHPLDTIKVRMQTAPTGTYKGIVDCVVSTFKEGGLRGFFNGATPAMTTAVIENTLVFGANETIKRFIVRMQDDPTQPLPISTVAGIGAAAGFFQGIFACPAEVIKCRLQVFSQGSQRGGPVYNGPVDCGRKIYAEQGIAGLYKGFSAFVTREVPFYLVFFTVYEAVCTTLEKKHNCTRDKLGAGEVLLAGGLAGCAGWTMVVPADTVKSQMQTSDKNYSAMETARRILKADGLFRGLFRGWTAIMIRAFPANAATFLGFELCRRYLPSAI